MAMTVAHKQQLNSRCVVLVRDLDNPTLDHILNWLLAKEILADRDYSKLKVIKVREEKVEKLLDILPLKGDQAYTNFLQALKEVEKDHLLTGQDNVSMTEAHRKSLKGQRMELREIDETSLSSILDFLYSQGVLFEWDCSLVKSKTTLAEKNTELLDLLPSKGDVAFTYFCQGLRDTGLQHLADQLDCSVQVQSTQTGTDSHLSGVEGRTEGYGLDTIDSEPWGGGDVMHHQEDTQSYYEDLSITSKSLVLDYIHYKLCKSGYRNIISSVPQNISPVIQQTLQKIADEFETRYNQVFGRMIIDLNMKPDTVYTKFIAVARELFIDQINWGRVVAIFVFAGYLVEECVQQKMEYLVERVVEWVTVYIDSHLYTWIQQHGGWNGLQHFGKHSDTSVEASAWPLARRVLQIGAVGAVMYSMLK